MLSVRRGRAGLAAAVPRITHRTATLANALLATVLADVSQASA
jgi:hypothetical protein